MKMLSKKFIALMLCLVIFSGVAVFAAEKIGKINSAWYNVQYLGAIPNDGIDDTEAIKQALSGGVAYLPEGEYNINDSLNIGNNKLVGDGSDKTIITADIENKHTPIIETWRTTQMEGVTVRYKEGLVTGEETECERIGIGTWGVYSAQRGSRFTDVVVENVGTGITSGVAQTVLGLEDQEDTVFSVTFDKLTVKDFSFRGIDFRSPNRTGNYFKELTFSSGKYRAESAIYWVGEESETAIDKLTVKDTIAETPIIFERMHGLTITDLVLDNVYALHYPVMTISSSVINVDRFTIDYSDVHFSENPLIRINKSEYSQSHNQTLNSLNIGTLKLNSFNAANAKMIFERVENETEPFYITVDEYIVKNSDYDWFAFPTSEKNLFITKKGEIATEGPTSDRPEERLCPYYSYYYDTDLKKTVVWTGEEWK